MFSDHMFPTSQAGLEDGLYNLGWGRMTGDVPFTAMLVLWVAGFDIWFDVSKLDIVAVTHPIRIDIPDDAADLAADQGD